MNGLRKLNFFVPNTDSIKLIVQYRYSNLKLAVNLKNERKFKKYINGQVDLPLKPMK